MRCLNPLAGDVTLNPNARCMVMTTEILRSMIYRGSEFLRCACSLPALLLKHPLISTIEIAALHDLPRLRAPAARCVVVVLIMYTAVLEVAFGVCLHDCLNGDLPLAHAR